jgi:heme-degrading monooxygenase HmoA
MVTIGMNYRVIPGKEAVFEAAFARVLGALGEAEGHEQSRLYWSVEGDPEYLIVSRWDDEDAFRAFVASDAFRKVTNWGAEHILAGPPRHTTYRES